MKQGQGSSANGAIGPSLPQKPLGSSSHRDHQHPFRPPFHLPSRAMRQLTRAARASAASALRATASRSRSREVRLPTVRRAGGEEIVVVVAQGFCHRGFFPIRGRAAPGSCRCCPLRDCGFIPSASWPLERLRIQGTRTSLEGHVCGVAKARIVRCHLLQRLHAVVLGCPRRRRVSDIERTLS